MKQGRNPLVQEIGPSDQHVQPNSSQKLLFRSFATSQGKPFRIGLNPLIFANSNVLPGHIIAVSAGEGELVTTFLAYNATRQASAARTVESGLAT